MRIRKENRVAKHACMCESFRLPDLRKRFPFNAEDELVRCESETKEIQTLICEIMVTFFEVKHMLILNSMFSFIIVL